MFILICFTYSFLLWNEIKRYYYSRQGRMLFLPRPKSWRGDWVWIPGTETFTFWDSEVKKSLLIDEFRFWKNNNPSSFEVQIPGKHICLSFRDSSLIWKTGFIGLTKTQNTSRYSGFIRLENTQNTSRYSQVTETDSATGSDEIDVQVVKLEHWHQKFQIWTN